MRPTWQDPHNGGVRCIRYIWRGMPSTNYTTTTAPLPPRASKKMLCGAETPSDVVCNIRANKLSRSALYVGKRRWEARKNYSRLHGAVLGKQTHPLQEVPNQTGVEAGTEDRSLAPRASHAVAGDNNQT